MTDPGATPSVRVATEEDRPEALGILDAAMLAVDAARVRDLIDGDAPDGSVLVAVEGGTVLGALVLDGEEVTAVAVRPGRRDQGIGSKLVDRAADRVDGTLLAAFDASVRPFYEALGFEIEPIGDGRFRGRRRDE